MQWSHFSFIILNFRTWKMKQQIYRKLFQIIITFLIFLSILQVICIGFVWKYKNTWQIPWTKVSNSQELFSTRTVESQAVYGGDGSHEMTSQLMPRTCHYWLEILIKIINYLCHMMNILPHIHSSWHERMFSCNINIKTKNNLEK